MDPAIVYQDSWGSIIDHGKAGFVEIRWYDTTEAMSAEEFKRWLSTFAGYVEQLRRPGILTDGTNFLMDRANLSDEWRDANIVPRYNAAGIKKFASTCLKACRPLDRRRQKRDRPRTLPLTLAGAKTRWNGWALSQ